MKKLLLALAFLLPLSASASIAAPWSATSTQKGYITPNLINGNNPWLVISGTGTSTFAGPIRSTCFSTDGTTCLSASGSGTVTQINTTWPILGGPITTTGTLTFGGLSTSSPAVVGNIPYFSGVNTFANVSTSTPSIGADLTYSGTLGNLIGGASGSFAFNLTAAHSWTGLQQFTNATSTKFTCTTCWIGTLGAALNGGGFQINNIAAPTSGGDAANKTYVDNAISGVNPAVAVVVATTQASDTSGLTYSNGVSGIGATFTGSNNTAITIDGVTLTSLNQRVLIKNDTQSPSGAFNGVYYLTQLQTAILPPILTRALDYDMPSDINSTGAIPVTSGTVNTTTTWVITSTVTTVGTDPLTYARFSINPSTIFTTAGTGLTGTGGNTVSFASIAANSLWANATGGSAVPTAIATSTLGIAISDTTGTVVVSRGGTGQTTFTSSQLLYGNGTNALSSVATSSISVSAGLTNSGTLGAQVGGSTLTLKQIENRSIAVTGTTTAGTGFAAITGTTTRYIEVGYGEVWNNVQCFTDIGTANVDFYYGSTHMFGVFNASTTIGKMIPTNSTPTAGTKVGVDVGTPASSPTQVICTVNNTN